MGGPDKSMDIHRGLYTYMTVQTLLLVKLHPLLTELYPVMIAIVTPIQYQTRGFLCSLSRHIFSTPMDSETWWKESSGKRLISRNGKTKGIALC